MSHIAHLYTLSPDKILSFFTRDTSVYLKLDGSFISVRVTDDGWFIQRKSNEFYHKPDDWPSERWADNFVRAHYAIEALFKVISPRDLNFEIMFDEQPNAIPYTMERGLYVHSGDIASLPGSVSISYERNGVLYSEVVNLIDFTKPLDIDLSVHLSDVNRILNTKVSDKTFKDILETNLNKIPKDLRSAWKHTRDAVRLQLKIKLQTLFDDLIKPYGFQEGFILKGATTSKMVLSTFPKMNRLGHIFRVALLGGTYPHRSTCFKDKINERSYEENIKRLEILYKRYMNSRYNLRMSTPCGMYYPYLAAAANDRVVNLFDEIKGKLNDIKKSDTTRNYSVSS